MRLALASLLVLSSAASAQIIPFTLTGDNFTGWTTSHSTGNTSQAGNFIGSGRWGLYANSSQTASVTYDFGGTLPISGTVSIGIDLGSINSGGTVGIGLQNGSGTNRFEFYFVGGTTNYQTNDSLGAETTSIGYSDVTIVFTQLASNTYSLTVNGNPVTTTNGNTLVASDISRIRLFNFNAGGGNDQFFDNLAVVPEPSTYAAAFGALTLGLVMLRRRRKA